MRKGAKLVNSSNDKKQGKIMKGSLGKGKKGRI